MRSITIQVSDEVAIKLAAEAMLRKLTVEELAAERIASPAWNHPGYDRRTATTANTNYVELADQASRAPSARKSREEIDADIVVIIDSTNKDSFGSSAA